MAMELPPPAFFRIHSDLPREGPGDDASTREALRRLPPLPDRPRVLDVGCGPGRQTLILAQELQTPITAVDVHEPFLDAVRRSAERLGLDGLITTRLQSMDELEDPPGSVDLIWSEGSIFIVGFPEGLRLWRPLLSEHGVIAATEAAWITENPPEEARAFWNEEYPAITHIEGNIRAAEEQGFEVFDHFILPRTAWWDSYCLPIKERIESLRPEAERDPELAAMIGAHEREIDISARFGDHFAYVFYLMRPVR